MVAPALLVLCAASAAVSPASSTGMARRLIYGTAWKKERTTELVVQALRAGFRAVDTACQPRHYHEAGVGEALAIVAEQDGLKREEIFLQTKYTPERGQDASSIPYDPSLPLGEQVRASFGASLANLRTDYVDSLLLHSPLETLDETVEAWRAMEALVRDGACRQIGISNLYELGALQQLCEAVAVPPAVVQNRLYADTAYDAQLREWCHARGIGTQTFWTLTANPEALRSEPVRAISASRGCSAQQAFFLYVLGLGATPLTGTTSAAHMRDDLDVLSMAPLAVDELEAVSEWLARHAAEAGTV